MKRKTRTTFKLPIYLLMNILISFPIAWVLERIPFYLKWSLLVIIISIFAYVAYQNYKRLLREYEIKMPVLERINHFKSRTLDTLLKVNHLFMDLNDSKDYYSVILNSAIDVIENASKGSILLYNSKSGKYEFQTCIGYDLNELKNVTMALEDTFLFMNSHGNYEEPIIVKNIREYDEKYLNKEENAHLEKAGGLAIEEALCSPIIIDGQIVAIINIDSVKRNAFDEVDKQLLHYFSTQIAIALKSKYLVEETINLSKFDKLTGALNRNYFEKITSLREDHQLEEAENYALVLCDLNHLKKINDSFGHGAGDIILKKFTDIIYDSIRETDIVSRIGGDEFVILLRSISMDRALEKMEQIYQKCESSAIRYNGHDLPVSFSYGIAVSPDDSMIYDILMKIADIRMYEFKNHYKLTHDSIILEKSPDHSSN